MLYYGTRLSSNLSLREPEGYLLCLNVPVARTGTQEYLPEELGLPAGDGPIQVYRPEEEVFAPACIASFEGMPVTNDHPPDGVTAENARSLQRGHAHNVRRGSGEESDLLLADLMITDPGLIDAILHQGKREISCGYTYTLCEENGTYVQRRIRGNHVAVVDAGRAGPRVSIRDRKTVPDLLYQPKGTNERRTPMKKKSFAKMLVKMAKDGDQELAEELLEEMMGMEEIEAESVGGTMGTVPMAGATGTVPMVPAAVAVAAPVVAPAETGETAVTQEENTPDEDPVMLQILEKLEQIIGLLGAGNPAPAADEETEDPASAETAEEFAEAVEEILEAAAAAEEGTAESGAAEGIAEMIEEVIQGENGEQGVLAPDECGENETMSVTTRDAMKAAVSVFGPVLAKMPAKQRRKAARDITARLRGKPKTASTYAAIAAAKDRKARTQAGADLGKRIMEKRNPNYAK